MSSENQIDNYQEVGKRSALICVISGLILTLCLILISFVVPFYVSTPYEGYHLHYYYNQIKYTPDINGDIAYTKCKDNSFNNNCDQLTDVSTRIVGFSSSAIVMIAIIIGSNVKTVFSQKHKHKFITTAHIMLYLLGIVISWSLLTGSIHSYMAVFPNTKYCGYNGEGTGCKWFTAITILLICCCILCILSSVLIGIIAPFCKIFKFLPWLGGGHDDIDGDEPYNINSMRDDESVNDYHHKPLIAHENKRNDRRKRCAYLTIQEWCSIILLSVGLVLVNVILILSYFNEWYPSDYHSQTYVNTKWNNAQCVGLDGYEPTPLIYETVSDDQCSFAYPDSDGTYNHTQWSCCAMETCESAFDYKLLMNGYNTSDTDSESYKCWRDMTAMVKASCHPNDAWFVPEMFNISQTPQSKDETTKLIVCALFCKQTYDHCADMIWNEVNHTVKQVFQGRFDEFCEQGLGVELRYEAFTDKCFAGTFARYMLHDYSIIFTVFVALFVLHE